MIGTFFTGVFDESGGIWEPCLVNDPYAFWVDIKEDAPLLSKLAIAVLSCAPHVASCERVWSMASSIITKERNRIKPATFSMLAKIKHQCRKSKEKKVPITRTTPTHFASSLEDWDYMEAEDSEEAESQPDQTDALLQNVHEALSSWQNDLTGATVLNDFSSSAEFVDDADARQKVKHLLKFVAPPK